jgi:hypothetical protein
VHRRAVTGNNCAEDSRYGGLGSRNLSCCEFMATMLLALCKNSHEMSRAQAQHKCFFWGTRIIVVPHADLVKKSWKLQFRWITNAIVTERILTTTLHARSLAYVRVGLRSALKSDIKFSTVQITMRRSCQSAERLARLSELWQRIPKCELRVRHGSSWHDRHKNCGCWDI